MAYVLGAGSRRRTKAQKAQLAKEGDISKLGKEGLRVYENAIKAGDNIRVGEDFGIQAKVNIGDESFETVILEGVMGPFEKAISDLDKTVGYLESSISDSEYRLKNQEAILKGLQQQDEELKKEIDDSRKAKEDLQSELADVITEGEDFRDTCHKQKSEGNNAPDNTCDKYRRWLAEGQVEVLEARISPIDARLKVLEARRAVVRSSILSGERYLEVTTRGREQAQAQRTELQAKRTKAIEDYKSLGSGTFVSEANVIKIDGFVSEVYCFSPQMSFVEAIGSAGSEIVEGIGNIFNTVVIETLELAETETVQMVPCESSLVEGPIGMEEPVEVLEEVLPSSKLAIIAKQNYGSKEVEVIRTATEQQVTTLIEYHAKLAGAKMG